MRLRFSLVLITAAAWSMPEISRGVEIVPGQIVTIGSLRLKAPAGWTPGQDVATAEHEVLTFTNGPDFVAIYTRPQRGFDFRSAILNGSSETSPAQRRTVNRLAWDIIEAEHVSGHRKLHIAAFSTPVGGRVAYGFARSSSAAQARSHLNLFLEKLH